jgi:hypothetical protein
LGNPPFLIVVRIRTNNERAGDTERNLTFWRAMMRDGRRWERPDVLERNDGQSGKRKGGWRRRINAREGKG